MGELAELEYRNSQGKNVRHRFLRQRAARPSAWSHAVKVDEEPGRAQAFRAPGLPAAPGDKLGLLGENGSGKSTLLKMMAGELQPDTGTLKQAEKLRVVTFDQHRDQLDLNMTLRQALCEAGEYVQYKGSRIHVDSWAARFLFAKSSWTCP